MSRTTTTAERLLTEATDEGPLTSEQAWRLERVVDAAGEDATMHAVRVVLDAVGWTDHRYRDWILAALAHDPGRQS